MPTSMPNAECQMTTVERTGIYGERTYDKPAERVWFSSSSACRRAAGPMATMRMVIIMQHADWNAPPRAHLPPLRKPQLSRVVGVLHRQRVRKPSRARVQRHPERRGPDRRLAALQVHGHGPGCPPPGGSAHHARLVE